MKRRTRGEAETVSGGRLNPLNLHAMFSPRISENTAKRTKKSTYAKKRRDGSGGVHTESSCICSSSTFWGTLELKRVFQRYILVA